MRVTDSLLRELHESSSRRAALCCLVLRDKPKHGRRLLGVLNEHFFAVFRTESEFHSQWIFGVHTAQCTLHSAQCGSAHSTLLEDNEESFIRESTRV